MTDFNIDERVAEAKRLFKEDGYNCCQAVACTFADAIGIDESLLYKAGEGFGAGMGTGLGVCGAISGAAMIAGFLYSDGNCERAGVTKARFQVQ